MPTPGQFAAALLLAALTLPAISRPAAAQTTPPTEPAARLVRDVIWNELHDSESLSHWEYLSDRTVDGQERVSEQVETRSGPVYRILERNGAPLTASQQQQESRRVAAYIHDPSAVARIERDHRQDEARLASIMRLLPTAFVYRYAAPPSGDTVTLAFQPNPAFIPSGYEARILHALTGTMTVNLRYKRMIDISGSVSQQVNFGYGLLGHVDQGGTFRIHRTQVSPRHWKTDLVAVHVQGKLLMFHTISKDEREARSDFQPVPLDMTLAQADRLLSSAAADPAVLAQLAATPATTDSAASGAAPAVSSDR